MVVRSRRIVPALLVLFVLFASQAAYAAGAFERPSGHCAHSAPQSQPQPCRLPLWLTCCDDHAAVSFGASSWDPGATLVLPVETALVPLLTAGAAPIASHVRIPPDTPFSRFSVLQI
jgi:hypothetical protein